MEYIKHFWGILLYIILIHYSISNIYKLSRGSYKTVNELCLILKTEENLRIMCEEAMTENGFLQVLQALNSLNIFQALQV